MMAMGSEQFGGPLAELVNIGARGVECGQECQDMLAHRLFD